MTTTGCQKTISFEITKVLPVSANIYIAHFMRPLMTGIFNNITSIRLYQVVKV